jgi:CPA2 family monovalent cation:H+ antiporter-2
MGVVFLLFMVGLDFTPDRLRRLGRTMVVGGSMQALLTIGIAAIIAFIVSAPIAKAILGAFIIIQSSTAIALKVYQERGEITAPQAEISIGISLFQDVSTVLLLVLIPILAAGSPMSDVGPFLIAGRNFLFLALITGTAYFIFPLILRAVIGTGIRELVVLLSLVLCLGFSAIARELGFSLALGSFLCGILLSRSMYHAQINAEITPFRDVFLSLFFISVGMLNDWNFTIHHFGTIILICAAALVFKSAIIFVSAKTLRFPFRISLLTGVGLSNIGEFGFVIMVAALPYHLLSVSEYQMLSGAAILSMLTTPLLIAGASKITASMQTMNAPLARPIATGQQPKVVVVGFGLAGRHLANVLHSSNIPYIVIEANGGIVQEADAKGEKLLFGDAARRDILEYSGVAGAQVIVFLIADRTAMLTGIRTARLVNPDIFIMCRTRRQTDLELILKAGADEVVSEEFETSIELFTRVLTRLHVPRNIIRSQTQLLRDSGYQMLRVPTPVAGISDRLVHLLATGTTDVFEALANHFSIGKSLRDLSLRNICGVSVIAVVRGDKSVNNPPADFTISTGDALVIMGSHAQIDAAFTYLENGPASKSPEEQPGHADRPDAA